MVKTNQFKLDATRPFYAVVGAGDLAVEYARTAATDVQARFGKIELEPKALRDQARTVVVSRVEGLTEDAKGAQAKFEARVAEFQSDAKALPAKVENFVNETVAEATETYGDLAARGKDLVSRIRKQATEDVSATGTSVTETASAAAKATTDAASKVGD